MGIKFDRGDLLREVATKIENLDLSHKGFSKEAVSINKDLPDEEIESGILEWAGYIRSGTISPATEAAIKLLVEEAFRGKQSFQVFFGLKRAEKREFFG